MGEYWRVGHSEKAVPTGSSSTGTPESIGTMRSTARETETETRKAMKHE